MQKLMSKKLSSSDQGVTYNPMDGIANIADVMLVLAVGIMLALVINWNVDIGTLAYTGGDEQFTGDIADNALPIDSDAIEQIEDEAQQIDGEGMQKLGSVYYDEATGTYYVIHEP